MEKPAGKKSIFDERPEYEKKREKKIWIDIVIIAIVVLVLAIMITRDGKNEFQVACQSCASEKSCESACINTCLKEGYDTTTYAGYNVTGTITCDCRCDHFLHSTLLGKKCDTGFTKFGDYCCADSDLDGVCDKYNKETLSIGNKTEDDIGVSPYCLEKCTSADACVVNVCNVYTNYICIHKTSKNCCGNAVCEQGEKCGSCFSDCGSCISVDAIKQLIDAGFYGGTWKTETDLQSQISYFTLGQGNAQIVRIDNPKGIMKSYADFKNFEFKPRNKLDVLSDSTTPTIITEKDYFTSDGIINEKVGYWKRWREDDGILFHNFNVYCSQDIYVRLTPDWTTKNYFYSEKYSEFTDSNRFENDRTEILPQAASLLEKCPLGEKQSCTNCSKNLFTAENAVDEITGKKNVFIKQNDGSYYSWSDNSIVLEPKDSNFNISNSELTAYSKTYEETDNVWAQSKIIDVEYNIKKNPEKQLGITRYYYYAGSTVTKNGIYSKTDIPENTSIYEKGSSVIYDYKIIQNVKGIDDSNMGNRTITKDLMITLLKTTFSCNNIVISISKRESNVYDGGLNVNQIDTAKLDIEMKQKALLDESIKIKSECEKSRE